MVDCNESWHWQYNSLQAAVDDLIILLKRKNFDDATRLLNHIKEKVSDGSLV